MTESQIVRVSKAEMLRVLHAEPSFADLFMTHLLTRNSWVEEDLVDQLFNSSEKRLARTLLLLANFGKEGGPEPITTHISQETPRSRALGRLAVPRPGVVQSDVLRALRTGRKGPLGS